MAGERRKDYMVSKRVHLLYMLTWVTSLLLVGSLTWMLVSVEGLRRSLPPEGANTLVLIGFLAFVIICSALVLAVYTIVHTHRVMGSAYRIGQVLKEINLEQDTRIHLRDGDFFFEIADEINILADKAQGKPPEGGAPATETAAAEPTAADAKGD
jgi:sensor histidine kinase YesM